MKSQVPISSRPESQMKSIQSLWGVFLAFFPFPSTPNLSLSLSLSLYIRERHLNQFDLHKPQTVRKKFLLQFREVLKPFWGVFPFGCAFLKHRTQCFCPSSCFFLLLRLCRSWWYLDGTYHDGTYHRVTQSYSIGFEMIGPVGSHGGPLKRALPEISSISW